MSPYSEVSFPQNSELAKKKSINESVMQELKDIMEDEFTDLIQTYLISAIAQLKSIGEAIENSNAAALEESAHSFKGSSANLGIEKSVILSESLEMMGRTGQVTETASAIYQQLLTEYQHVTSEIKRYL